MITSSTSDFTMPLNAVPITIPTAKSITLPRMMKSLNSCFKDMMFPFRKMGYKKLI